MLRASTYAFVWMFALSPSLLGASMWPVPALAHAQEAAPVGTWQTIDDSTSKPKSHVQISARGGKLYGKIVKLLENPDARCDKCTGADFNKPILGMTIMWDLVPDGDGWSGGKIFDPESGKTYRCKIWMDGSTLKVRGYLGPLFRTQTWHPLAAPPKRKM